MVPRLERKRLRQTIANLLENRDPVIVFFRYVLVVVFLAGGVRWLIAATISLTSEMVTRKDFLADYVMGKAVLKGINPYLPISELVDHFQGRMAHLVFAHPCPHPPPVGLMFAPLALFPYQTAATIWLLFELVAIGAIVVLLSEHVKERQTGVVRFLVVFAAFAWYPFGQELVLGQLTAPLLLLLVLAWRSLQRGGDLLAGIFLGLSLSIKLFTWPFLVLYLIRRRWRLGSAGIATVVFFNLLSVLVMGIEPVRYYFGDVSGAVFDLYKSAEANLSLWTIGWRLFQGTGSPVFREMHAHPLFDAPGLAGIVSTFAATSVLLLGLLLACRARSSDVSFAILTCIAILISPIAWPHYLMIAALPVAVAVRQSLVHQLPGKVTAFLLTSCVLLFLPYQDIRARLLSDSSEPGGDHFVPFALTLPIFLPVLALFLLVAVLWRLDRISDAAGGPRIDVRAEDQGSLSGTAAQRN